MFIMLKGSIKFFDTYRNVPYLLKTEVVEKKVCEPLPLYCLMTRIDTIGVGIFELSYLDGAANE